jgi:hypothetical protein
VEDAVGDVVPQGAGGAVHMRRLPAGVAVGADQIRPAIETAAFVLTRRRHEGGIGRGGQHSVGCGIARQLHQPVPLRRSWLKPRDASRAFARALQSC